MSTDAIAMETNPLIRMVIGMNQLQKALNSPDPTMGPGEIRTEETAIGAPLREDSTDVPGGGSAPTTSLSARIVAPKINGPHFNITA